MNSKNSNPIWLLSKKELHNNIITFTSKKSIIKKSFNRSIIENSIKKDVKKNIFQTHAFKLQN